MVVRTILLVTLILGGAGWSRAGDWSAWRGPRQDGSAAGDGALAAEPGWGAWRVQAGAALQTLFPGARRGPSAD